jgi:protease IV
MDRSMPLEADYIVDRRRLRRKLTTWRVIAVLIAVAAVLAGTLFYARRDAGFATATGNFIARVKIQGLIRGDTERTQALERLARSSAKAVVVHVDSPGGTTAGSEQLFDSLRRVAAQKPLVVVVDGLAASGGYITAMAGDYIVAQSTSLVGSVGVIFQYPNVTELMKTIGVKVEEVKSTPLKASPSAFEPTSPEARAAIEAIVMDSYAWFRGMVQNRRKLDGEALERVVDGRVFTGRQAIDLKLIDQLGDEKAAVDWLAKEKGIDAKTPVRDWQLRSRFSDLPFLHVMTASLLDAVGLTSLARRVGDAGTLQAIERLSLDGLLALWHPPVTN